MDIVDAIAAVPTANARQHQNVPVEPVMILSMTRR
jgi:cyclophilin family peptidyl-prolyl cis-trans isomerase